MTVYLPERQVSYFFPGNFTLKTSNPVALKNRGVPNGFPALNLIARFVATESIANDKIIITVQVDEGAGFPWLTGRHEVSRKRHRVFRHRKETMKPLKPLKPMVYDYL